MSSFLYYVSDFIVVPFTGSVNKGIHTDFTISVYLQTL